MFIDTLIKTIKHKTKSTFLSFQYTFKNRQLSILESMSVLVGVLCPTDIFVKSPPLFCGRPLPSSGT